MKVYKLNLIGITGLIGSGKTTVGNIIQELGYIVFDMDKWCAKLYKNPKFLSVIEKNFPTSFENGIFYKKKLRNIVFSNKEALQTLEKLTHPYLKKQLLNLIHKNRFNNHLFFIETALLYQMNLDNFFNHIIITEAPYDIILKRTIKRDNITKQEFENIIKRQNVDLLKNKYAYKINTNQSLARLKTTVIQLIERM